MRQITKSYLSVNVYEAALERMAYVFDHFEEVFASVSGGKDSSVLAHMAREEARRRGRKVNLFFLDQEAEYQATIDVIRGLMSDPWVRPWWFQVPIRMTNATSYAKNQLYAWGPDEEWMREKDALAIQTIDERAPERFYPFFEWFEKQRPAEVAFLVGLRAEEGIHRFRAVTKNPGMPGIPWSTKTARAGSFKLYPLYDFGMGDVWKYIHDQGVPYNRIYDLRWAMNRGTYNDNRVSNLIHEISFRCLVDLPALEPETYARLLRRLPGVHCAARHAGGDFIYDARRLPEAFSTWRTFRDHLLTTMPIAPEHRARFEKRFATMADDEAIYQAQCKRLLIGDHENNVPITTKAKAERPDKFARWRKLF